jgi:hypothetical protein
VSREASPEDKIWLSFKVCDFGQRQALGAPELANLLVTLLAQHGRALAEAEVAAIVKHTLQMGDLNRSGALEYDEFTVCCLLPFCFDNQFFYKENFVSFVNSEHDVGSIGFLGAVHH